MTEPRIPEPRVSEPRTPEPRTPEPRAPEPRSSTPAAPTAVEPPPSGPPRAGRGPGGPPARRWDAVHWRATTRRLLPYVIVAAGAFLAAYLFVFFFVFPSELLPNDAKVLNVVGLSYDDASRRLEAVGLKSKTGETRFHATAPKGTVLEQLPRPSVTVPRGTVVRLDVSAGQRTATIPRVVGATQQQAQVLLENAGFDIGDVVQQRGAAARGTVVATEPGEGQTLPLPRTVTLTVSAGPPTVVVPDLMGRTLGEARSAVEQVGLKMGPVAVDSAALEDPNVVIGQTPAVGASVSAGSAVRLRVSGRAP